MVRYSAGLQLEKIYRETTKLLTMDDELHPESDVDRCIYKDVKTTED